MPDADLLSRLRFRHDAMRALRSFFDARGFYEVETSQLVIAPTTEPHIDPLEVPVALGPEVAPVPRYLRTSPELALKRMIAGGATEVYEIGKVFRDKESGPFHLPEFVMLEWYRAKAGLEDIIDDLAALLVHMTNAMVGRPVLFAPDGTEVDVDGTLQRASVSELFWRHAQLDLPTALDEMAAGDAQALVRRVRARGYALREGANFEDAFFHVMVSVIEPAIAQGPPLVVERWPKQMAVLARLCDDDPRFAGRFELYAGGLELANAFDELTDPIEQRARFEADNAEREQMGKPRLPLDEEFLRVLAAMPPTAGIALGVDRFFLMLRGGRELGAVQGLSFR